MKKFLSLFCALAIVLSASAAPVKKARAAKFQRAAVEQLRAEKNVTAKKTVKKNAFSAKEITSIQKNERIASGKTLSSAKSALRAPKALAETVDVKCGSWEIEDYGAGGQVYLYAEDNTVAFLFDVIYGEGNDDLVLGKKYTLAEMDSEYSEVFHDGDWHGLVTAEITKTVDEKGLVHFVGACSDSLDASFTFHYDEPEFIPTGDTIKHNFAISASLNYNSFYEDWTISAADNQYAINLDIFSKDSVSAVGNYTSNNDDFDLNYTNVEIAVTADSSLLIAAHDAKASIFEQNDTLFILAEILGEDGVVYQFGAFNAVPTKLGVDTIEATNLVIDDSWYGYFGIAWADASNDNFDVSLTLYELEGDLEAGEDFSGSINKAAIYSGAITVGTTEEGKAKITGKVLCYDNIEYTLNLIYVVPEPTRQDTIAIKDGRIIIYPEDGLWLFTGYTSDSTRFVQFVTLSDQIAGTYTEDDLFEGYNFVSYLEDGETVEEYDLLKTQLTVTFNAADSTATVAGTFRAQGYYDGKDVPEFTFDFKAQVSIFVDNGEIEEDGENDLTINFPGYTIDNQYLAKYAVLFLEAQTENNEIASIELWLPQGAENLVAGEYPIEVEEGVPGSVTAGTLESYNLYGSFAGTIDEEGYLNIPLWFFASGNVTVSSDLSVVVEAVNTKGYKINLNLGGLQAVENVDAKVSATKRIVNGQLLIEKNGVRYNVLGTPVK